MICFIDDDRAKSGEEGEEARPGAVLSLDARCSWRFGAAGKTEGEIIRPKMKPSIHFLSLCLSLLSQSNVQVHNYANAIVSAQRRPIELQILVGQFLASHGSTLRARPSVRPPKLLSGGNTSLALAEEAASAICRFALSNFLRNNNGNKD